MCIASTPKVTPPVITKAPTMADTAVDDARQKERTAAASSYGSAATDVTKGALEAATTAKKTALGN